MGLDHIVYLSHSKIRHILHTRRVPDWPANDAVASSIRLRRGGKLRRR